jgi:hypothetical protein
MNYKETPANKVGFMYMRRGDGGASNIDPQTQRDLCDVAWHAVRPFDAAGPLISLSRGFCVRFTSDLSPPAAPGLALR